LFSGYPSPISKADLKRRVYSNNPYVERLCKLIKNKFLLTSEPTNCLRICNVASAHELLYSGSLAPIVHLVDCSQHLHILRSCSDRAENYQKEREKTVMRKTVCR